MRVLVQHHHHYRALTRITTRIRYLKSQQNIILHNYIPITERSLHHWKGSKFESRSHTLATIFSTPFCSMTTPQSQSKTVRVMIKGRVQGVFYRNWTVDNATQLGLNGWVRNRRDGSVEALFSGDPSKVQQMEDMCRRGPPDALVTGLQVFPSNDDPGTGFHRIATL